MGFTMNAGMEAEFFLFKRGPRRASATTKTHDVGGYFDLAPVDLRRGRAPRDRGRRSSRWASRWRRRTTRWRTASTRSTSATPTRSRTADNIATFRFVVKHVAQQFGLVASFMPKPIFGQNGSGMHTHQSLFKGRKNAFWDADAEWELSRDGAALHRRAAAPRARHVRDHEPAGELVQAPRAGLRGAGERRVEHAQPLADDPRPRAARRSARASSCAMPDPAANPYLALAVMLAAGLDGIETQAD